MFLGLITFKKKRKSTNFLKKYFEQTFNGLLYEILKLLLIPALGPQERLHPSSQAVQHDPGLSGRCNIQ